MICIEYDDNQLDVIDKVNAALISRGIRFVAEEEQHDGYELLQLEELANPDGHDNENQACAWNNPETFASPVTCGMPCTCPAEPKWRTIIE